MPNGYHGSRDEWLRLEAPLREVDPVLEAFASSSGYTLSKNYRGDPERSLVAEGAIRRLIQIFVADPAGPTFKVWLCASQDRGLERYWKRSFLTETATAADLSRSITNWLEDGRRQLEAWGSADLEFATKIQRVPPWLAS